jgi:hypothetical protein
MTSDQVAGVWLVIIIGGIVALTVLAKILAAIGEAIEGIGTHRRWSPPEKTIQYWSAQSRFTGQPQITRWPDPVGAPPRSRRGYNPWPLVFVVGCLIVTIVHAAITGH